MVIALIIKIPHFNQLRLAFKIILLPYYTYGRVENSQLQFEPFRSGRDGQVGTGAGCRECWANWLRLACCRSLSRLRRASVACQDISVR